MELNIKIDNNPLIKFKIKEWDNFVELISFEVWKALIKRRWDYGMSEERFTVMKKFDGSYVICDKGKMLVADDCCDLLNEQQELIEELQEENKELKHWKNRIIEYLTDWFQKTEYLSVLYKINEIRIEIGLDKDE